MYSYRILNFLVLNIFYIISVRTHVREDPPQLSLIVARNPSSNGIANTINHSQGGADPQVPHAKDNIEAYVWKYSNVTINSYATASGLWFSRYFDNI